MYKRQPAEFTHTDNRTLKYLVRTSVHFLEEGLAEDSSGINNRPLYLSNSFKNICSVVQGRSTSHLGLCWSLGTTRLTRLVVGATQNKTETICSSVLGYHVPFTSVPFTSLQRRPLDIHQLLESQGHNVHMRCYTKNTLPAECMQFAVPFRQSPFWTIHFHVLADES